MKEVIMIPLSINILQFGYVKWLFQFFSALHKTQALIL